MNKEPSSIKKSLGDFAPKLVQLTDDVLFGDVWERPELAPHDRSLFTVAALVAGGNSEQLPFHLNKAKENGLSEDQIIEVITHLAFYCGWPKAMSAIGVAKETFKKQPCLCVRCGGNCAEAKPESWRQNEHGHFDPRRNQLETKTSTKIKLWQLYPSSTSPAQAIRRN